MKKRKSSPKRKKEIRAALIKETTAVYTAESNHFAHKKNIDLSLFANVQFIYELHLAKLELESFGLTVEITNGLRKFITTTDKDTFKLLLKRTAYFGKINNATSDYYYIQKANQTRSVNQYLTHWFYPYKGKFHPQMIRALLNLLQIKQGDTVLDPFIGSGTTALEAMLMGINCVGYDISTVCTSVTKSKTESIDAVADILKMKYPVLSGQKKISHIENEKTKNFFKVAELIAHSDAARRGKQFNGAFNENVMKMIQSLQDFKSIKEKLNLPLGKITIEKKDSRNLPLTDDSIDGIITSPPYSIALNYVENDAHSLEALGYDLKRVKKDFIGVRGNGFDKFELYDDDMKKAYSEMHRVLKPGKYCAIIIGNVTYQGKEVDTTQHVIDYCQSIGFTLKRKIDKIIFGLYNVMMKEYILIFQKER
ncbi:MAG: DNA methyltransferase [Endomicrobiia bacterium]|nr:DNA methyltransferase [Endomicrobiia bacterium]